MTVQYIVLSDLDGTLLDHHNYDWSAAAPALNRLKNLNIPVILNTSKTVSEVEVLSKQIGLHNQPYVVENGSALILNGFFRPYLSRLATFPQYQPLDDLPAWVMGEDIKNIHEKLNAIQCKLNLPLKSYRDWTVEQLAAMTGLSLESAAASKAKYFSEPFIFEGNQDQWQAFLKSVSHAQLSTLQGGRFHHLQGQVTKASIIEFLKEFKAVFWPHASELNIIALGDGGNDVHMLEAADYAICIKSPVNEYPKFSHPKAIYSEAYGPQGWNEEINALLNELKLTGY